MCLCIFIIGLASSRIFAKMGNSDPARPIYPEKLTVTFFNNSISKQIVYCLQFISFYIIIRVHSAFSLVASCVLLKYTRTADVN